MALTGAAGGRISAGAGANLIGIHATDRNQDATCYVGSIESQVTEELLWELMVQAGPVVSVYMPKDRVTNEHQGYGFVEFKSEEDADYAIKILNMIKLFGKPLRVNKASQDRATQADVGANLFIGNLDPDVDETVSFYPARISASASSSLLTALVCHPHPQPTNLHCLDPLSSSCSFSTTLSAPLA
jgi:splicing factor 3B subunit 4